MHAHASEGQLGDGGVFFVLHFPVDTSRGRRVLGSCARNFKKLNATHGYFGAIDQVPIFGHPRLLMRGLYGAPMQIGLAMVV
jgi:hypothetical protein